MGEYDRWLRRGLATGVSAIIGLVLGIFAYVTAT